MYVLNLKGCESESIVNVYVVSYIISACVLKYVLISSSNISVHQ